jgi:hypothetical protein
MTTLTMISYEPWPWLRRVGWLMVLAVMLAACAPATMPALRGDPSATSSFVVDQPYQQVYRTNLERSRACHWMSFLTGNVHVENDLYPDLQRGEIRAVAHDGFRVYTILGIDVVALALDRTMVTTYSGFSTWNRDMRAVEAWVTEGATACR